MCGACCKIAGFVRLHDADVKNIADHLGVDTDFFIEHYTDIAPDRQSLVLKEREDGACILLSEDNLCLANDVKPEKCKTFPFDWTNSNSTDYCPALSDAARR